MILSFWNIFLAILFLMLFFLLLIVLYKNSSLNIKLKKTKQLILLSHEIEKKNTSKIGEMIHDKIQGDLIAIKNFIFIYSQLKDEETKNEIFSSLQMTLEESILNAKKISHKLSPPFLDSGDFIKAIEYYFDSASKSTDKHFLIRTNNLLLDISEDRAYVLFRIIEMFCDNVIRDEKATKFLLNFKSSNEIELIDDGNSFVPNFNGQSSSENLFLGLVLCLKVLNGEIQQQITEKGNHFVLKFINN
ncbi:hypothetical protein [Flavobacterium sp. UBA7682]|uniref:hypothetical protein n=1 Tax=Flavobacterium sp. UBA7682 TaxID=1946560 RepID=UPI0025BFF371|nr:hypothetical protein [Flavobacterium sp. UBA7682]